MQRRFCDICEAPALEQLRWAEFQYPIGMPYIASSGGRQEQRQCRITVHAVFGFKEHRTDFGGPPDLCQGCLLQLLDGLASKIRGEQLAEERHAPIYPTESAAQMAAPVNLLLYCPNCGEQHIDAPQPDKSWDNPPHRSHECQFCTDDNGEPFVWRPADVPTNGVAELITQGQRDGSPRPRYYATAHDFNKAVAAAQAEIAELRAKLAAAEASLEDWHNWLAALKPARHKATISQARAAVEAKLRADAACPAEVAAAHAEMTELRAKLAAAERARDTFRAAIATCVDAIDATIAKLGLAKEQPK